MNNVKTIISNAINALDDELKVVGIDQHTACELYMGRLFGEFDRGHVYSFHGPRANIADGTSVDLLVGKMNRDARLDPACVIGYRGAKIILSSVDNPGLANEHPSLRFEPGSMLKALNKRLRELQNSPTNANLALLATLFAPPSPADPPDTGNVSTTALVDAALARPVSFIWAPPGTDQNGFITSCATRVAAEGDSALIVNDTTAQTDAQTLLLADSPAAKQIVRVGAPMPDALKALQGFSPASIARQRDPLAFQVLDRLTEQIADLLDAVGWRKPNREIRLKLDELEREKSRLEQFAWEAEQNVVDSASIVLAPLGRAVTHPWVYGRSYDVVIIGNAQHLLLAQIVWAAALARKAVIVTGDFRQAPNWIKSRSDKAARWLKQNVFEASGIVECVNRGHWDSRLRMLQVQQTMHPQIARIVSEISYGGRLLDAPEAAERTAVITAQPPEPGQAIVFYDVRHLQTHTRVAENGRSRCNLFTAVMALSVVGSFQAQGPRSILLVSPYLDQWRLHQSLIREANLQHSVTPAPLDRCAYPQHHCLVLDLVDTAPVYRAGYPLWGGWGSESMQQLTSVFSSGRGKLVLIGDRALLLQTLPEIAALRGFLREMQHSGAVFKPFPADLLHPHASPKNCTCYADPGEAWQLISQDIAAASQRVYWNWPFANADEVFNRDSLSWLFSAKAKGALALSCDDPVHHPLVGCGLTVARSIYAEAGVQIDSSVFWLIGANASDGTTRPFVRFSGRRVVLQIAEVFGLNVIFPKVNFRPWFTREPRVQQAEGVRP